MSSASSRCAQTWCCVYGSQQDLKTQLARASIPTYDYRHGGLTHVDDDHRETWGNASAAPRKRRALATSIERGSPWSTSKTARRKNRARCWSSGASAARCAASTSVAGADFCTTCSTAAGGVNVFADVTTESVQASSELILTRAPEVIIELRTTDAFFEQRVGARDRVVECAFERAGCPRPSRASSGWQVAQSCRARSWPTASSKWRASFIPNSSSECAS